MKTLMLMMLLILSACNGSGGGSSSPASFTLDERLFSGTGRWSAYDAGTNIEDAVLFRKELQNDGSLANVMHWLENYRLGSNLINTNHVLTPVSDRHVAAKEFAPTLAFRNFEGSYSFIDDDTLELCIDGTCITFTRVP